MEVGGYDVEFIDEHVSKQDLTCSICLFVLREPMQANPCGHRFCKSCIEEEQKRQNRSVLSCPNDRIMIQVFPDVGREREILDFKVKCTNHSSTEESEDCLWNGELRTLEKHLKNHCLLQIVECEKKCNKKNILRKQLAKHLEEECENNLACKYSIIGCPYRGTVENLGNHLITEFQYHLHLQVMDQNERLSNMNAQTQEKIKELEEKNKASETNIVELQKKNTASEKAIASLKETVEKLQEEMQMEKERKAEEATHYKKQHDDLKLEIERLSNKPKCPYTFILKNISDEIKKGIYTSHPSPTFEFLNGYRGKLTVDVNYNHPDDKKDPLKSYIAVFFGFVKGPLDGVLDWPLLFGEVTVKLIINDKLIKNMSFKCETFSNYLKDELEPEKRTQNVGSRRFIECSKLPQNIDDDELEFVVDVK